MNFTTTLTEKDKKLLSFIGVILVAAIFGLFIIKPLHTASAYMRSQISDNQSKVDEVSSKVQGLETVRVVNENEKAKLELAQQEVYPMMRSNGIDRILSEEVDKNGLSTNRLQIVMPKEPVNMIPFLAAEGTEGSNPEGLNTLYAANVSMEITGSKEGLDRIVDEIARNMSGIRIESLSWSEKQGTADAVTGIAPTTHTLTMVMSVYMSSVKMQDKKD